MVKMLGVIEFMERRRIGLYLLAIAAGGAFGWLIPAASEPLEHWINPVLGLLLYATFLGIPFAAIGKAVHDIRFMGAALTLNPHHDPTILRIPHPASRTGPDHTRLRTSKHQTSIPEITAPTLTSGEPEFRPRPDCRFRALTFRGSGPGTPGGRASGSADSLH
ncbi:hypothetical protein [Arthrobacter sp. H5]|uniref:hypothetical protein n=1 Tax=Arthrobacter sp. H5 TaxID=1267973 RepID=UPI001C1E56A8|nr:hypothetical protein [Arthrobacter sp. H5]